MFLKFFSQYVKPILNSNPWTNVYGLARSIIAIGTLLTFLANDVHSLFIPLVGVPTPPVCNGIASFSFFCLFPDGYLILSKWIAIIILAIVASGWRPRITGILHWWISFSFIVSATLIDGGDQIAAVITLLLIPITLTDDRKWHWADRNTKTKGKFIYTEGIKKIIAYVFRILLRIQVALIYLQAFTAKLDVVEWVNGTSLYYWLNDPMFGPPDFIYQLLEPFLLSSTLLPLMTWGVLLIELLLFAALFMPRKWWTPMLKIGLLFHFMIVILFGLVSFFCTMAGGLILYLYPLTKNSQTVTNLLYKSKNLTFKGYRNLKQAIG